MKNSYHVWWTWLQAKTWPYLVTRYAADSWNNSETYNMLQQRGVLSEVRIEGDVQLYWEHGTPLRTEPHIFTTSYTICLLAWDDSQSMLQWHPRENIHGTCHHLWEDNQATQNFWLEILKKRGYTLNSRVRCSRTSAAPITATHCVSMPSLNEVHKMSHNECLTCLIYTDFRLSSWLIADDNSAQQCLYHVDLGSAANIWLKCVRRFNHI
jgi:hypothetical protein